MLLLAPIWSLLNETDSLLPAGAPPPATPFGLIIGLLITKSTQRNSGSRASIGGVGMEKAGCAQQRQIG